MEASHRLVPGRETAAEWGEGDDYPVYWVNFDESELFCKTLTERARDSGGLPTSWEFRIPTEAQWEIRLPRRDHDRDVLRRPARPQPGELRG